MSNIDFYENRNLRANIDFQSRNAKITRFWNRVIQPHVKYNSCSIYPYHIME